MDNIHWVQLPNRFKWCSNEFIELICQNCLPSTSWSSKPLFFGILDFRESEDLDCLLNLITLLHCFKQKKRLLWVLGVVRHSCLAPFSPRKSFQWTVCYHNNIGTIPHSSSLLSSRTARCCPATHCHPLILCEVHEKILKPQNGMPSVKISSLK